MYLSNLYFHPVSAVVSEERCAGDVWLGCNVWLESPPVSAAPWYLVRHAGGLSLRRRPAADDEKLVISLVPNFDGNIVNRWREEHPEVPAVGTTVAETGHVPPLGGGGRKDDTGKPDLSLIPRVALVKCAEAFMVGEKKYSRYNYCAGMAASRVVAALQRHAASWFDGEETDSKDGQHHLGSVMACAAMLLRMQELGTLDDDRFRPQTGDV